MSAQRRRKQPTRTRPRRAQSSDGDFWGTERSADVVDAIEPTSEPTALIASLGPPPLLDIGPDAMYPLAAVYDRAAALANAVAAASGLLPAAETDS
jgi:hypothetical protein